MVDDVGVVVEGRSCKGCTLCCKIVGISELEKPPGVWCTHCDAKRGCTIYDSRPGECRGFYCGYLTNRALDERWNPAKCKIVLAYDEVGSPRLMIYVDPARAGVWREEPYYSQIKAWAAAATKTRGLVLVRQGPNVIVVLPDREKDVGNLGADQLVYVSHEMGPRGMTFDAIVVDRDDPRVRPAPPKAAGH